MRTIVDNTRLIEPVSEVGVSRITYKRALEALLPLFPNPTRLAQSDDYHMATEFALRNLANDSQVELVRKVFASRTKAVAYLSGLVEELSENAVTPQLLLNCAASFSYEAPILTAIAKILETAAFQLPKARSLRETISAPEAVSRLTALAKGSTAFAQTLHKFLGSIELHTHPFLETWERNLASLLTTHSKAKTHTITTPNPAQVAATMASRISFQQWNTIEGEVASALQWVANQVAGRKPSPVVLPEIAVLGKREFISQVASELSRLAHNIPYVLAGGRSVLETTDGARIRVLLDCLEEALPTDDTCTLLASFRAGDSTKHGRGWWIDRANEACLIDAETPSPTSIKEWSRLLSHADKTEPFDAGIKSLIAAATAVLENRSMAELVAHIQTILTDYSDHQIPPTGVFESFLDRAKAIAKSPIAASLSGLDAIETLQHLLENLSVGDGRARGAYVYLGSVPSVLGCRFTAVFLGHNKEGVFPSGIHEDPLLPDHIRSALALPLCTQRPAFELAALGSVLENLTSEAVVSWSTQDASASERDHSSLVIDLFAAANHCHKDIGKHLDKASTDNAKAVLKDRTIRPFLTADVIAATIASGKTNSGFTVPTVWPAPIASGPAFSLAQANQLRNDLANTTGIAFCDGVLGKNARADLPVHGLSTANPISATVLRDILSCPWNYMLQRLLQWKESPSLHDAEISALEAGNIIHACAQKLYESTTPKQLFALSAKDREGHKERIVDAVLANHTDTTLRYLKHDDQKQAFRKRLLRALDAIIEFDKGTALTNSPASEVEVKDTVAYKPGASLSMCGQIDRITKKNDGKWSIVDFKSGKNRNGEELNPAYDIQLVAYALLAASNFATGAPPAPLKTKDIEGLGFVYPEDRANRKRWFEGREAANLITQGREWFAIAASILDDKLFIRTTERENCKNCGFKGICEQQVFETARQKTETSRSTKVKAIRSMWPTDQEPTP